MKSLLLIVTALLAYTSLSFGQIKLQEGFETSDETHLPAGWSKWNQAAFPIDPLGEWFVQDTARYVPGIDSTARRSVAHASLKAAQVSWYSGIDTNTNAYGEADTWLVTKRIRNIEANDSLIFWAIGGNGGTTGTYYFDTLEVWMDTQDSLPVNITYQLSLLTWNNTNSRYGVFKRYAFPLGLAAGQDLFVGFRYLTNVSIDGYAVFLDDVLVKGPLTSVAQEKELPTGMSLSQNYPNPFNPSTTIEWSVPSKSNVAITIFNMIGQEITTLVNSEMEHGTYRTTWDASRFPSGVYAYRIQVGTETQTRKMVFLR